MRKACVQPVQKLFVSMWVNKELLHKQFMCLAQTMENYGAFPPSTHSFALFLYPAFTRIFSSFESVIPNFVHIFHIPYKHEYNSNKGVY